MRLTHLILWLPCIAYYCFITLLSDIPGTDLAGIIEFPFDHFDKFIHFILYMFLGMVLSRALAWEEYYHRLKKWVIYFSFIIPFAAMLDEVHQYFVPARSMDFGDWIADVLGAIFGAIIYILVIRGRRGNLELSEVESKDVRGFGLIVAMIYFLILISLNVLNYKHEILKGYQHLAFAFILVEYGMLGLLTIRFFYLRTQRKYFSTRVWLYLLLFGACFILLYQICLWNLKHQFLTVQEVFWSMVCYYLGAVGYYLDKQIEKYRKKVLKDPLYKRVSWQRVYFFLPSVIIIGIIYFMSSRPGRVLYGQVIPLPSKAMPQEGPFSILSSYVLLHFIQYFMFSIFYFRAVAWECWWQTKRMKKIIWTGAILLAVALAFGDEILQFYTPGRYYDIWDVACDLVGVFGALLLYFMGYHWAKKQVPAGGR